MKKQSLLPIVASITLLSGAAGAAAEGSCGASDLDARLSDRPNLTCGSNGLVVAQNTAASSGGSVEQSATVSPAQSSDVDADGWLNRAKQAVQDAGREIGEAATATGRSAADYLADNPDLNQQVLEFGQDLGIPGFDAERASGARLDAVLADGRLQIEAVGLPRNQEIQLGWLEQERFVALETLSTGANGAINTDIAMPAGLEPDQQVILAVETADRRLRLTSAPITQEP